jgi:hypothetical protein
LDRRTFVGMTNLWITSSSLGGVAPLEEATSDSSLAEHRARLEVEVNTKLSKLFTQTAPLPIKNKRQNGAEVFADGNDVITWWRKHRIKFLIISELTRIGLATPAWQCDNKRAFSAGGLVTGKLRTRICVDNLSILVFLMKDVN